MKGYIYQKTLFVFPQTADEIPYVDPEVTKIAIQPEQLEAFKEANTSYADLMVAYNYNVMTVNEKVWAGHTDDDIFVPVPPTPEPVDPELAWSDDAATVTIGADDNVFPTLSNPHYVAVSYTSSDESAATINENGEITLVAAGSTTISAVWEGNDEYYAATETYTLTVEEAAAPVFEWDPAESTIYTDEVYTLPTLTNTTGSEVTAWTSDNPDVATIDEHTGTITIVGMGQVNLEAAVEDPETHELIYDATCTLLVSQHASATIDGNGVVTIKLGADLDDENMSISPVDQDVLTAIFTENPNFTITYNGETVNNPTVDCSYDETDPQNPVLMSVNYQDNDAQNMFGVENWDGVSSIGIGGDPYNGGTFVLTPVQL